MIWRMVRATGYSGVGRFFSAMGNLIFVWTVSRHLDAAALGVYGLLFFFTQLFSGIAPLGHPMYLAREVARQRDDRQALAQTLAEGGSALFWGGALSVAVWSGLLGFYNRLPIDLLNLAVVAGVLWGIEYQLGGVLIGLERLGANAVWHGVSLVIIALGLIGGAQSLRWVFILRIVASGFGLVGRLWTMRDLKSLFSFTLRLRSYRESSFFWYSGWVYLASRQLDMLVLSFFLSEVVLGGYFLAMRIFLTFGIVAEVLGVALIPFISRAYHGHEDRSIDWLFRWCLVGIGSAGILFGLLFHLTRSWLVALFNPLLVNEVAPILGSLAWVIPFSLGNHIVGAFFSASEYQRERFFIHLAVVLVNCAALVPLVFFASTRGAVWVKMGTEILLSLSLILGFLKIMSQRKKGAVL